MRLIMAGSTRLVTSPPADTSLLARCCNKAERERYFVFGESRPAGFSPGDARDTQPVADIADAVDMRVVLMSGRCPLGRRPPERI